MEFVIPAAGDPAHRQPGFAQPGCEIRLACRGRWRAAWSPRLCPRCQGVSPFGGHGPPRPDRRTPPAGTSLPRPGPGVRARSAGPSPRRGSRRAARSATGRPGWQFSSKSACKPAGCGDRGEPPPRGVARQPVARYTPRGQLAAEPLVGLVKAAHPQPLVAAVARQVQRVAIDSRQCFDQPAASRGHHPAGRATEPALAGLASAATGSTQCFQDPRPPRCSAP